MIVEAPFVVPIPVGHRVEVRWFAEASGLFRRRWRPREDAPLVGDLDTGIVYGNRVHFCWMTGSRAAAWTGEVNNALREVRRVVGRVRACTIVDNHLPSLNANEDTTTISAWTMLSLDVEEDVTNDPSEP